MLQDPSPACQVGGDPQTAAFTYYGLNSSLYGCLEPSVIQHLERAIRLTDLGEFQRSRCIFDGELFQHRNVPVVAIERAELALRQGRHKEIWETLEQALEDSHWKVGSPLDEGASRLMRIFRALAAINYKGTLEPAKEEIEKTREWLRDVPVDAYTDVQVHVIRKYVLASLYVTLFSNNDEFESSLIPRPNQSRTPWQGLTDLRVSLLNRGMVFEAVQLFKVERNRLAHEERADAVHSFKSALPSKTELGEENWVWVQAELSFQIASTYADFGETEDARQQLNDMSKLLDQWCELTDYAEKETLAPYLNMRWLRMKITSSDDPFLGFQTSVELLKVMEASGHLRTDSCFGIAMQAAYSLATDRGLAEYESSFLDLQRRLEVYQEHVLGDLVGLTTNHYLLVSNALKTQRDLRKGLEWLEGFLGSHPNYSIPFDLHRIHKLRIRILEHLGEQDATGESRAIMDQLEEMLPTRYGPLVGVRSYARKPQIRQGAEIDEGEAHTHASLNLEEENFWADWTSCLGDTEKTAKMAMRLVLKWMPEDLKRGVLSEHEVHDILYGMQDENTDGTATDVIKEVKMKIASDVFAYFTKGKGPVNVSVWDTRFSALSRWLHRRLDSPIRGRQFLLVNIQQVRIELLQNDEHLAKDLICECERAIEACTRLTPKVRDFLSLYDVQWRRRIVGACLDLCSPSRVTDVDEYQHYPEKAEQFCLQAMDGFKRLNELEALAFVQRSMACICLYKLHRLVEKSGEANMKEQLEALRDAGLKVLEDAHQHFVQVELEAGWSESLPGLKNREHMGQRHVTMLTISLAMLLLMEGNPVPNEVTRTRMWNWVQRSKARSLAMTLGLSRVDPALLVRKVQESEECRKLYERMLELQNEISRADVRGRHHLRRGLDQHKLKMREHDLLRQLLDIRQGKPLATDDIRAISEEAGASVVLVDWYEVGDFFRQGTYLLFTARVGSAPTVNRVPTSPETVGGWIKERLEKRPSGNDQLVPLAQPLARNEFCEQLGGLVEPLNRHTAPGEILVFCPTSVLHRISLHALDLKMSSDPKDLITVIRRNPVLYSHSHSLLRACFWAAKDVATSTSNPLSPLLMNGLPGLENSTDRDDTDGREFVQNLANRLGVAPLIDNSATKSAFICQLELSRLIHVQTHGRWDSDDPLAHQIEFQATTSAAATADKDSLHLTARDIFSTRLQTGAHLNLIACEGGLAAVVRSDEVNGLVPALLYSGASSTVSTLWEILDSDGTRFGEEFFKSFKKQCQRLTGRERQYGGNNGGGFVNLAKAFQRAVVVMDEHQAEPLISWAGFILHGFWLFFVPDDDATTLAAKLKG